MERASILEPFEKLRIELEYAMADFQKLWMELEDAIGDLEREKSPDALLLNFGDFLKARSRRLAARQPVKK